VGWFIRIPLFIGQVNMKPVRDTLFSERYGLVPTFSICGVRLTWRKWR